MRVWALLIGLIVISGCQIGPSPVSQPPQLVETDWGIYPFAENVSFSQVLQLDYREADKTLSYGSDPLQFGKLWLPADTRVAAPLVIFIHGGCWLSDYDLSHSYAMATALARAGFAVWSVEYRRTGDPGGGWPGSLHDVVQAINYIQLQDNDAVDLQSVTLTGHSAGGHLAMLAEPQVARPITNTLGLAPIIDIETYGQGQNSCQRATHSFMGGTHAQRTAEYARANLLNAKLKGDVNILSGELDTIVPLPANPLTDKAFRQVPGAGHFDWLHPGTPAFAVFIELLKNK